MSTIRQIWSVSLCIGASMTTYTNWVASKQQKFISHSSGGWKFKIRVPAWLVSGEILPPGWRLLISCWVPTWWKRYAIPFIKTLFPFMRDSLWRPKTPLPHTITLGIRISTHECERDTNIQTTATRRRGFEMILWVESEIPSHREEALEKMERNPLRLQGIRPSG